QAARDKCHHLLLARGQPLKPPAQLAHDGFAGPSYAVPFEPEPYRIEQVLLAKGLGEELDSARLHRLHRHGNVAMAGDEDDGNPDVRFRQFALKVQPAHARQAYVEYEAARRVRSRDPQEIGGRIEYLDFEANRTKEAAERRTHRRVVVDDENDLLGVGHLLHSALPGCSVGKTGRAVVVSAEEPNLIIAPQQSPLRP